MSSDEFDKVFSPEPLAQGTSLPTKERSHASPDRALTQREKNMFIEFDFQTALMELQGQKTEIGQQLMADLTLSSARIFAETMLQIWNIKVSVKDPELLDFIYVFC